MTDTRSATPPLCGCPNCSCNPSPRCRCRAYHALLTVSTGDFGRTIRREMTAHR